MAKTASNSISVNSSSQKSPFCDFLIYALYGHPRYFKFKRKYRQYGPRFQTIFLFLTTMLTIYTLRLNFTLKWWKMSDLNYIAVDTRNILIFNSLYIIHDNFDKKYSGKMCWILLQETKWLTGSFRVTRLCCCQRSEDVYKQMLQRLPFRHRIRHRI